MFFFTVIYLHTHRCRSRNSCLSVWYGRPGCLLSHNPFCCWGVCSVYSWVVVLRGILDCHICVSGCVYESVCECVWECLNTGVTVRSVNVCGGLVKWNAAMSLFTCLCVCGCESNSVCFSVVWRVSCFLLGHLAGVCVLHMTVQQFC